MKTRKITITNQEIGFKEALDMTEELGGNQGLNKKENLRLRLLTEELIGMVRGVTEEASADYWVEQNDHHYVLHLEADVKLNRKMREQILTMSSSGENVAAKGFMGKLKEMVAVAFLPDEYGNTLLSDFSLGLMSMASNTGPQAQQASAKAFNWSLQRYKAAVEEGISDNKFELEHSIVASLADDVVVSVTGSHVEVMIDKTF